MRNKRHCFGIPTPLGYIVDVGRGATEFTISDIGPTRDANDVSDERHVAPTKCAKMEEEEEAEKDVDDNNYDEFLWRFPI